MVTCSLCSSSDLGSRPRGSSPSPSPTRQALHPSKWPTRAAWPPSPPRPSHRSPCPCCPLPFRTCLAASPRRRTSSPSSASEVRAEGDVNTWARWRRGGALMLAVFMELTGGHFASVWQLIRNPICALTLYSCYRTTCTKRGVHISLLLHISRQILKKVAHPHGSDAATVEEYTLAGFRSGFPPVKMAFYFFLISLFDLDTHAAVYTPPPSRQPPSLTGTKQIPPSFPPTLAHYSRCSCFALCWAVKVEASPVTKPVLHTLGPKDLRMQRSAFLRSAGGFLISELHVYLEISQREGFGRSSLFLQGRF